MFLMAYCYLVAWIHRLPLRLRSVLPQCVLKMMRKVRHGGHNFTLLRSA
ncbi:Uncharacterised protein [Vibrio cholerae]|nr:Uncharacterised protein [Vibrio cholerae]